MQKRTILFDFDGVLFPTEEVRAQAHAGTVARFGRRAPPDFYARIKGAGKPHEEVRRMFIQASVIQASQERYTEVFQEILASLYRKIQPTQGIVKVLERLHKNGDTLAVVSSSGEQEVYPLLEKTALQKLFGVVVTGDEGVHKKPAPDLYILALKKLGVGAECAVAVEDSESGLQSANAAGIPCVAFRHEQNARHDFSGAWKIAATAEELSKILEQVRFP